MSHEQPDAVVLAEGFAKIEEAMHYLNLSRASVYSLMDRGELRYAKFGRSRRIPRQALRDYARRSLVGG